MRYHIGCAGDQAPSQQLGGLSVQDSQTGMAANTAGVDHLTEPAAQRDSVPGGPAVSTDEASASMAAGAALSGRAAAQADAKAAFQRRVHAHFSRLMVGGGMTPAAAAAQALKLAAEG